MNIKKILCLTAALSISSHVFALEIYKGKMVNEKIWSTSGVKAKIGVSKKFQNRKMHTAEPDRALVQAVIASQTAKINTPVEISNDNRLYIVNYTDEPHVYNVEHSVCSETSDAVTQCVHYWREFEISSGGYVDDDFRPVLELTYTKPGIYKIDSFSIYTLKDDNYSTDSVATSVVTVS